MLINIKQMIENHSHNTHTASNGSLWAETDVHSKEHGHQVIWDNVTLMGCDEVREWLGVLRVSSYSIVDINTTEIHIRKLEKAGKKTLLEVKHEKQKRPSIYKPVRNNK